LKSFWKVWHISLVFKLVVAALLPLGADEAYYWVWSKNLQLSYYDHPAMIAWIFKAGHFLEPFLNAVRWPGVVMGHLTLVVWFLILRKHINGDQLKIWIYLILFSPLLGFGSIILTPDLPVLFFWSLALLFALRALERRTALDYFFLGIALGLGFSSKYHIVLFLPCLIFYLQFEKRWHDLILKFLPLTMLAGIITSLPVIIWNFQNEFSSIVFQLKHGLEKSSYDFIWTASYVLGEVLLIFPLIFYAALKASPPKSLRWLPYFAWTPLLFFFFTSFRASTELNWPIIAFPAALTLSVFHRKIMSWSKIYIFFWAFFYILVIGTIALPTFRKIHGKIEEPYQLRELAYLVQQYRPLYADSYQVASSLWYFSKTPVFKLKDMSRFDFFDTLKEAEPSSSKFYLIQKSGNALPSWIKDTDWTLKLLQTFDGHYLLLEFSK
jgi:4-amino-4-deoxy-L-arabinose transferase-like glycosyltransferase